MSSFEDNWLPNIVVNTIFHFISHPSQLLAGGMLAWGLTTRLRRMFRRSAESGDLLPTPGGDLVPSSMGTLSGTAVTRSAAYGNLTPVRELPPRTFLGTDIDTYAAAQGLVNWQSNLRAAQLAAAGNENLGSPPVLLRS